MPPSPLPRLHPAGLLGVWPTSHSAYWPTLFILLECSLYYYGMSVHLQSLRHQSTLIISQCHNSIARADMADMESVPECSSSELWGWK